MNDDTIYRRAAIDAIESTDWYHIEGGELVHGAYSKEDEPLYKAKDIYSVIENLPSAQPEKRTEERWNIYPDTIEERPTGEWIYGEHDVAMCDGYWCDQCGFFVPWDYKYEFIDFIKDYHWCPNCGARMNGGEEG